MIVADERLRRPFIGYVFYLWETSNKVIKQQGLLSEGHRRALVVYGPLEAQKDQRVVLEAADCRVQQGNQDVLFPANLSVCLQ